MRFQSTENGREKRSKNALNSERFLRAEKRASHRTQICDKEGIMIKAYKGFNKNMQCRGFQFEEGKSYEEQEAILCEKGFHACENPIDVFRHYAPGESIFRKVELEDVSEMREKDSKVCGKKIKIGEEISLRDMIREGVKIDIQTANGSTAGQSSPAATSGDYSPAATSDDSSPAATAGDYSPAATLGDSSHAATSGNCSRAATAGDYSPAATSGNYSPAATAGNYSPAATSGKESIAAAIGMNSKAKSTIGNWIVLAEYGGWDGECYPVLCVKCGKIDGEALKPDVWYKLEHGEFTEAQE